MLTSITPGTLKNGLGVPKAFIKNFYFLKGGVNGKFEFQLFFSATV